VFNIWSLIIQYKNKKNNEKKINLNLLMIMGIDCMHILRLKKYFNVVSQQVFNSVDFSYFCIYGIQCHDMWSTWWTCDQIGSHLNAIWWNVVRFEKLWSYIGLVLKMFFKLLSLLSQTQRAHLWGIKKRILGVSQKINFFTSLAAFWRHLEQ